MLTAEKLDLESLVKTKLPPLPGSLLTISNLLRDVNVSQRAIAGAIGYDPMLASRILQLANSPIYSCQQQVTSLNTAVGVLGNKIIYETLMIGAIADSFGNEIKNSAIGRDNWLHSLATAFAARELGLLLNIRGLDEAFSCGLLHDIGKLLLFRADAELYTRIFNLSQSEDLLDLEREFLGFEHAQVGALAARRWHLSDSVCNVILYHHNTSNTTQGVMMTNLVSVADQLCYLKNQKLPIDEEFMFSESIIMLGFTAEQLDAVWETVLINLREVVKAFFR